MLEVKKDFFYKMNECVPKYREMFMNLTLVLLSPAFANSVDPDQLASREANRSGSALFGIQYVNLYQQPGSSNLTGWKLEVGLAS